MDSIFLIYSFQKIFNILINFTFIVHTIIEQITIKFNSHFTSKKYIDIFVLQFSNYSSAKFYYSPVNISAFRKHVCRSPTFPKIQSSDIHLKVVGGYINLEQRLVKSSPHPSYANEDTSVKLSNSAIGAKSGCFCFSDGNRNDYVATAQRMVY